MTKPVVAPEEKAVVEAAEPIEKEAIKPATLLKAPIKKIEAKTKKWCRAKKLKGKLSSTKTGKKLTWRPPCLEKS